MDYTSFSHVEAKYEQFRIQCRQDFPKLLGGLEEAIRFQKHLADEMAQVLNDTYDKNEPSAKKIGVSHALFSKNSSSLYMAYLSTFNGVITSSNNLSRTIYESILTQYYIGLYDDDMSQYIIEKGPTYEGNSKYTHNFFKLKLYECDRLDEISGFYHMISDFVHSNSWTWIDNEYDPALTEYSLRFLLGLSLFNVLSYAQLYKYVPQYIEKVKDLVQPFVDEALQNSDYKMLPLFPNKQDLIQNVFWHNDKQC